MLLLESLSLVLKHQLTTYGRSTKVYSDKTLSPGKCRTQLRISEVIKVILYYQLFIFSFYYNIYSF